MSAELNYALYVKNTMDKIQKYYTWSVPWFSIALELFTLGVLFLRKPSLVDKTNVIYLYKWQYVIGIIYALNMIFNDSDFASSLFGYDLTQNMTDAACKVTYFSRHYIYFLPSWMQVVINNLIAN